MAGIFLVLREDSGYNGKPQKIERENTVRCFLLGVLTVIITLAAILGAGLLLSDKENIPVPEQTLPAETEQTIPASLYGNAMTMDLTISISCGVTAADGSSIKRIWKRIFILYLCRGKKRGSGSQAGCGRSGAEPCDLSGLSQYGSEGDLSDGIIPGSRSHEKDRRTGTGSVYCCGYGYVWPLHPAGGYLLLLRLGKRQRGMGKAWQLYLL